MHPEIVPGIVTGDAPVRYFIFPSLVSVPKGFAKSHSLSFSFLNWRMEFSSQSREMLLFFTINMAVVTSSANQQYFCLNYFYLIFPLMAYLNHLRR